MTWGAATSVLSVLWMFSWDLFCTLSDCKEGGRRGTFEKLIETVLPQKTAQRLLSIAALTNQTFTNFVSGQLTEAVIIGVLCFFGMLILGIPYAGAVSAFVAVTALVPIFWRMDWRRLWCVFDSAGRTRQGSVVHSLSDRFAAGGGQSDLSKVVGKSVGLPGLLVLMAVTIGGEAFGILGMLFSVPSAPCCSAFIWSS